MAVRGSPFRRAVRGFPHESTTTTKLPLPPLPFPALPLAAPPHTALSPLLPEGKVLLPVIPPRCTLPHQPSPTSTSPCVHLLLLLGGLIPHHPSLPVLSPIPAPLATHPFTMHCTLAQHPSPGASHCCPSPHHQLALHVLHSCWTMESATDDPLYTPFRMQHLVPSAHTSTAPHSLPAIVLLEHWPRVLHACMLSTAERRAPVRCLTAALQLACSAIATAQTGAHGASTR